MITSKMTIAFNPPIHREFVEPSPSDAFIYWLFKRRCVDCRQPASEINEILPRSRSKKAVTDWKNRVPMCHHCHRKYHDGGVTDEKMTRLYEKRQEFLIMIGRYEYIG